MLVRFEEEEQKKKTMRRHTNTIAKGSDCAHEEDESAWWGRMMRKMAAKRKVMLFVLVVVFLILGALTALNMGSLQIEDYSIDPRRLAIDRPLYSDWDSPIYCDKLDYENLVLVGALGGSGTRGVQALIAKLGWFGGAYIDDHGDTEGCYFQHSYESKILAKTKKVHYTYEEALERLGKEEYQPLEDVVVRKLGVCERQLQEDTGMCFWGFKNPRSIYFWPIYYHLYPKAKFIHIVRDGRDMAYSENTNQLRFHGDVFLPKEASLWPKTEQQAAFWSEVNVQVAKLGQMLGPSRYRFFRIEDLVTTDLKLRERTIKELISFIFDGQHKEYISLHLPGLMAIFDAPADSTTHNLGAQYGKWKQQPVADVKKIESRCKTGLDYFGYKTIS